MADEELGSGSITITLDDSTAEGSAQRLGDRIEDILNRASRDAGLRMQRNIQRAISRINPAQIRIEADLSQFDAAVNSLNNLGSAPLRVTPDVDRAQFEAAVQAALTGLEVSVRVTPDLDGFDAAIRAHNTPTVNVNVNADVDRGLSRSLGALGGALGGIGRAAAGALRLGAVGIAAASAAQGVFALTAALAPAAGALAALPAVIAGAVAANAALKLALNGVGDAFSAALTGDAEKFEESLKNLSPAAQAAAREVRALKPAFEDLRSSVQDAFFAPLEGQITNVAAALDGPLNKGLSNIAGNFGLAAQRIANFLQSALGIQTVTTVLKGTDQATQGLAAAAGPVAAGFLRVAGSVSEAFGPRLQAALANTGARFGQFLGEAAASGQAVAWVEGALTVFQQLGAIASNVGDIISGVFGAANDVGGGLLNNLEQITQKFSEFVNSASGQESIGNIFSALSTVAAQLAPIFAALVTQVGQIAPALTPIFQAIGPAITSVITALGPLIQGVLPGIEALVSSLSVALVELSSSGALAAIGQAIGAVGSAIAPILPLIGQLVASLATALAPVITALATAIAPVVQAFSAALAPVLPVITGALVQLATALTPVVVLIGETLASVIGAVAPLLGTLAGLFAQVVTALTPLIEQITAALVPIFQQLTPIISAIVAAIIPLVQVIVAALLPILPPLVDAFLAIVNAVTPLLPVVGQLVVAVVGLATSLIPVIAPIIQFGAEIIKWLAINAVVPIIKTVVAVIGGIIGVVTSVITAVSGFVTSVVGFFSNLRTNVSNLVRALVDAVVNFFTGLPSRAVSVVSAIVPTLATVFVNARNAVMERVRTLVGNAVDFIRGLPGKAKAALSGIAGNLVSAGSDLIRGFISGIKNAAAGVARAAVDAAKSAVNGVKNFLGISSPSKVFIEIGKFTAQGLVKGMTGERTAIKAAADKLVKQITDAFKGRNTKLDDRLIAQVRSTQKRLEALADQRVKIADKIKQANEFATQTAQSVLSSFSLQDLAGQRGVGVQGLTDGLDTALSQIRRFNGQINELATRGLRRDLLQQIIGLGPTQGAALATSLTRATDAQIADLNEAQKQVAAAATQFGKTSADALFDSGKQAAKGFLAGLKGQQAEIEKTMLTIAKAMSKSIRKALGIRSPSRVFAQIGRYTMDGLGAGIESQLRSVRRSVVGAANALTDPFGAAAAVPGFGGAPRPAALQGRAVGSRTSNVTVNLNSVGYSDADAQRIVNRVVSLAGL